MQDAYAGRRAESFDLSPSIDLYVSSMPDSRERAIAGIAFGLIAKAKRSLSGEGFSI